MVQRAVVVSPSRGRHTDGQCAFWGLLLLRDAASKHNVQSERRCLEWVWYFEARVSVLAK